MSLLEVRIVLQHVPEHGDEHEQQREQAQEAVVRDAGRKLTALVVAELLQHADDEAERRHAVAGIIDRFAATTACTSGMAANVPRAPSGGESAQ